MTAFPVIIDAPNPDGRPANMARLFFEFSRTVVVAARPVDDTRSDAVKIRIDFPVVDVQWVDPDEEIPAVELMVVGQPPVPILDRTQWFVVGDGAPAADDRAGEIVTLGLAAMRRSPVAFRPNGADADAPLELGEAAVRYRSEADRLRREYIHRVLEQADEARRAARAASGEDVPALRSRERRLREAHEFLWFFYELDKRTNPVLFRPGGGHDGIHSTLEDALADALGRVMGHLLAVQQWRLKGVDAGDAKPLPPASLIPDIRWFSAIQRPIYERCLSGNLRTRARIAFARFASGEFYRSEAWWNAAPDSEQFVLFAEFTLLCLDLDIDAGFWSQVLDAHVMSQPIYDKAFRNEAGARVTGAPSEAHQAEVVGLVAASRDYRDGATLGREALERLHSVNVRNVKRS